MPGPHPVGHQTFTFSRGTDGGDRSVAVEVWYPSRTRGAATSALASLERDPARSASLSELIDEAPEGCLRPTIGASRGLAPAIGAQAPVLIFSHCHVCTRWSGSAIAERLASHGFVVVAPDHEGNTLWDELDGSAAPVGAPFLRVRADDIHALVAALRGGPGADLLPPFLRMEAPPVAVLGHSFGAVTAGLVAQEDPAIAGVFAIAAPLANPLVPGVSLADLGDRPLGFLLAREDNSITPVGNTLLRRNFEDAEGPRLLAEIADLGHWGMSDVVGLLPMFAPGCGQDRRMTNRRETFTYLPPERARDLVAGLVTSFFVEVFVHAEVAGEALTRLGAASEVMLER